MKAHFDVIQKIGLNFVNLNKESNSGREEKWKIVDLDLGPEYAGSVACNGIDWKLTSNQFDPAMIPVRERSREGR